MTAKIMPRLLCSWIKHLKYREPDSSICSAGRVSLARMLHYVNDDVISMQRNKTAEPTTEEEDS